MAKPIIRHCMNCEYAKIEHSWYDSSVFCEVKYKRIDSCMRLKALLCSYYKPIENVE